MKKSFVPIIALLAILIALSFFLLPTYNGLVKKEEYVSLQWNEVQNAYQRRLDLVPNLVAAVKGGAQYEQETLNKVAAARGNMASGVKIDAATANRQIEAQSQVATAVNQLLIRVENYPDLKGTTAFVDLQNQLEGTERRIKFARKDFNTAVQEYNNTVRSFPTKLVAGAFGFSAKEGFSSDVGAEKAIEVNFIK